jgi:ribose transport system substrate-binding protein
MKKLALAISLVCLSALGAAADYKGKIIALVPKTLNNPFFVAMSNSVRESAEKYGFEVRINAPDAETEVDKQIGIIETFIEQGVDVLITGPCSTTSIVDTIKLADSRGIPVFLIDSGADESPYVTYVGTNNYEGGRFGARWIGENVKGDVAILDGFSGNDATTQRYKGFMDEIAKYPGVKVVASEYANCELAKGMEVTENFLTAYPNLKGIFAVNDNMAIGAGNAVAASGRRPEIKICGFDGQPNAAQDIIDGNIDATIAQKPVTMGKLVIEQVVKHLDGRKVDRIIDTGCDIVEAPNAKKYLDWQ